MIVIKEAFDLFDIWRVRQQNPRDSYFGKIMLKTIFKEDLTFFVSNMLQEWIGMDNQN